jgi:hypothetical protein
MFTVNDVQKDLGVTFATANAGARALTDEEIVSVPEDVKRNRLFHADQATALKGDRLRFKKRATVGGEAQMTTADLPMSALGQQRRFGPVPTMSALPLTAGIADGREGPIAEVGGSISRARCTTLPTASVLHTRHK